MPREVFVAGQVLTAAELNVVSDQSVMVFAGTAARGSAIPSPTEGMVTYLEDSNQVQVYNGSGFTSVGSVLQVVSTTYETETTTTSATFVSGGISASITPASTSNKILVIFSGAGAMDGVSSNNAARFTLFRGDTSGTDLGGASSAGLIRIYGDVNSPYRLHGSINMSILDSPSTVSPQVYTMGMLAGAGVAAFAQISGTKSTLTLMEIAG